MAPRTEVAVDLVTKLKDKGFKDLQKNAKGSEKAIAALGKKLGTVFGAAALAKFAKDSVKAFLDDERAAKSLTRAIGNLGLAFEDARVKKFISDLEKTSGVTDDTLRPAFQKLIQTTGSVTKSQELLKLALDLSADGSVDLVTAASDLSRAYVGSTKGLKKYSLGLTDAELKGKSFAEIQKLLNERFSGQNAARLETYQGKLDLLNVSFENFKETIGRDLITALERVSGDQGVGGTTSAIDKLGKEIGDAIVGTGELIRIIKELDVSKFKSIIDDINLLSFTNPYGLLNDVIRGLGNEVKTAPKPFSVGMSVTGATDFYDKIERARKKAEEEAARRAAKIEADRIKREKQAQAEKKRTAEIERLKSAIQFRFDIDAINLQAALRRNISASDRERVLQLSALKISDYQNDEEAIKTLQAATQGRYDDAMNLEKMLQLLTTAGFANSKAAIDALAAMKPDIKFTDNLDSVISRLKALIEGKYSVNIGVNTGGLGTTTGIGGTTITSKGATPTVTGPNPAITNIGKRVGDTLDAIDEAFFGSIQSPAATSLGPNPAISNIAKRVGDTLDTIDTALLNPVVTPAAVAANPAISNLSKRVGDTVDFGIGAQAASPTVIVNVTVEGSLLSQQDLVSAVTDAVYETQRTGNPILIAV
jgi:hypothetical protein